MSADPPELFLIDGNSLAYRAFFALPESIGTSDGRPTNAIYGLASMLVKIIDEHHPAGVVVAWDAGMSGREVTYDLYKAQRKPRPDLLREQWPHLMPLVEAFGYVNVKVEGYEADDVIASIVRQARAQAIEVMVVTGDRDAYQLVGEGVRVMSTSRGITETKIYDREAVLERYGVPPELITDLMGLRGDTSDNIPGVPGIGEKTATQLLQQFGSLEDVLANVGEVSGAKRKQNLVEHADDARLSKQLATLQYEIETGVDLAAAMAGEPDRGALRDFMREFELRAVLERLEDALPDGEAVPGRSVERELEIEVVEGTPADLGDGPAALAVAGDRWAAAEGERILAGSSSRDELAVALSGKAIARPRRQVAGRGPARAARRRRPRGRRAGAGPRHDGRRLSPRAAASHLRADRARRRCRDRPRRERRRPSPRRTTASWRSARRSRPASTPARRRAWSPLWPKRSGRGSSSWGWGSCCTGSSCRSSTCWRRWSGRACSSTPGASPRSGRASASASTPWKRRSSSWPERSSRSAPPSRWDGSSSRSSA